jgi:hypothetical protein
MHVNIKKKFKSFVRIHIYCVLVAVVAAIASSLLRVRSVSIRIYRRASINCEPADVRSRDSRRHPLAIAKDNCWRLDPKGCLLPSHKIPAAACTTPEAAAA